MILFLDTTNRDRIIFAILEDGQETARKEIVVDRQSEQLLSELEKFLQETGVKLQDIEKVEANTGPGPFTSVRTGVAAVNTLNFALGNDEEMVLPKYNKPPNITQPKKI